jgi:hypothetical protein
MGDLQQLCAVIAGVLGLGAFMAGTVLAHLPRVDADDDVVVLALVERRRPILRGAVLSVTGATLLLWPIVYLVISGSDGWASLLFLSLLLWTLGFGILSMAWILVAGLVWRDVRTLPLSTVRLALDTAHLATWSVSAPLGAGAIVATTWLALQSGAVSWVVGLAAAFKVVTVVLEVAGTTERRGWNAGGWAGGISGYATVCWFVLVLLSLL